MLLNRKGFVKIAVESGLDGGIIPVYHYGNTQVRVHSPSLRRYALILRTHSSFTPTTFGSAHVAPTVGDVCITEVVSTSCSQLLC
jgi:hypothetical protein